MNETMIPWDFLELLFGVLIVLIVLLLCIYAFVTRRSTCLTIPRENYINRPRLTRKVREEPCRKEAASYE